MAANYQQFGTRSNPPPRKVNEVGISNNLEQQLSNLTALVQQIAIGQVKTCGICSNVGHPTDMCPTLQETNTKQANAMGGYQGQKRQRYDPLSNTDNLGWRDHPNLSYRGNQQASITNNPPGFPCPRAPQSYQARPKMFPTLKWKTTWETHKKLNDEKKVGEELIQGGTKQSKSVENSPTDSTNAKHSPKVQSKVPINTYKPPLLFPSRFATSKKEEHEQEILVTFRKVHVNIPLLDAIKQVPRYAKFLKELCTNKRKLKGNDMVSVGENVSTVLQRKLLTKCKDLGSFTILCIIGNPRFEKAMLDLGASINVMPYSIYLDLNLGTLKETGVVIQLTDRSSAYPKGVLGDVLVQVNELDF
ncbi:uncharacterized protein LOC116139649 [Pistacia vera]|uniref:uncharacterized protein LOC116139649 n=1 Tax=Pistacia vera TaxID=55513 RepID=UPI001263CE64|nr:uncharacterized protein LOC116139649 [Pistacia vera]